MLSQTFCQSLPNFLQNGSKIAKFCLNFRPTFATATHLTSQINSKSIKAGSLSFENWAWFGLLSLRKWSYDFATWNRRVKSAESASPHSSPASNLEQRLGLRLSLKDLHRNFVQPCPNFYMGWKVRNLAHMLFLNRLWGALLFETNQQIRIWNLNRVFWSADYYAVDDAR